MDEQHLESDPVCAAFPDDMLRIVEIYSGLPYDLKQKFMQVAEVFLRAKNSRNLYSGFPTLFIYNNKQKSVLSLVFETCVCICLFACFYIRCCLQIQNLHPGGPKYAPSQDTIGCGGNGYYLHMMSSTQFNKAYLITGTRDPNLPSLSNAKSSEPIMRDTGPRAQDDLKERRNRIHSPCRELRWNFQ
jgi:hypothetical protein